MPIPDCDLKASSPAVSIGVPVYNGERFIRQALDSALRQTFQDFEIIISDNSSSDGTQEICRAYAARDPRIKYIRQDKNHGMHWNLSFVAYSAAGRFFTWLAHDDVLEPGFLEQTLKYMSRNPQVVLTTGDFAVIDENGCSLRTEKLDKLRDDLAWSARLVPFFEYGNSNVYFCIYGLMQTALCKSVMAEVKEPNMADGIECPILSRFAVSGEIVSLPIVLRKYRIHNLSVYQTEVTEQAKKSNLHRIVTFYSNLFLIRLDLWKVLLSAEFASEIKIRIIRRHLAMDSKWIRFQIEQSFLGLVKKIRNKLKY